MKFQHLNDDIRCCCNKSHARHALGCGMWLEMTLHAIELAYSSKSGALAEGCNITMTEWCRKRKGIILTVVARCCLHNSRDGPCHLSICIHSHRISSGIRNNS
uniref:Uncharacterized protein n=1 Tax=Onchocerca volvulus TaxID=6282 RepID=A0A8R1TWR2_ONCVO